MASIRTRNSIRDALVSEQLSQIVVGLRTTVEKISETQMEVIEHLLCYMRNGIDHTHLVMLLVKDSFKSNREVMYFLEESSYWKPTGPKDECLVEYVLRHSMEGRHDFTGVLDPIENNILLRHILNNGELEKLKIYLRYGILNKAPLEKSPLDRFGSLYARLTFDVIKRLLQELENEENESRELEDDMIRINLISTLELYMKSVPAPFPTEKQVVDYSELLRHEQDPWNPEIVLVIYRNCFPEMVASNGPRNLQHLSRCSVRKSLKNCFRLPSGIRQLNVIEDLHNYLELCK